MDLILQPDRERRAVLSAEEERQAVAADVASHTKRMRRGQQGAFTVLADFDQTPQDKIARERLDLILTAKAESRQGECWADGCHRHPSAWVREVRFDLGDKSGPLEKAVVDTSHYNGPVPGFCFGHQHTGAGDLASKVYHDHPTMAWGFRPSRFFVIFTDGTVTGGEAIELNATPHIQPVVTDEHVKGA